MHVPELAAPLSIVTGPPKVQLLAWTARPYDIAIASARTCYSPNVRSVSEVNDALRERLGAAIYEAGHHTPFQHPTFVFGLENVSRQLTWSFLHSHPYYNSEQSSQRYNVLTEAAVRVPELGAAARAVYEKAVLSAWDAYNRIHALLQESVFRTMHAIGRIKGQSDKKIRSEAEKKSVENARYVLPVAAFTSMYHTISGIELMRYARMARSGDCPTEALEVVTAMLEAVRAVDPDFVERIHEDPLPTESVVESAAPAARDPDKTAAAFDRELGDRWSKLVDWTREGERLVADSAREVLGYAPDEGSDDDLIEIVMNPSRNAHHLDTLNTWTHSPLMRTLNHVNYTFKKRISHTADSQDQRHRTVPASRPLLTRTHTRKPDYVTPEAIAVHKEAKAAYDETMQMLWDAKNDLVAMGVPAEHACYLLPNATAIRFTTTGNLLGHLHKWRLRTCFNAQREIYEASMDEVQQVAKVHPRLARHIGPPCLVRAHDPQTYKPLEGPCPEGAQWCGVRVWVNFPKVKRPY